MTEYDDDSAEREAQALWHDSATWELRKRDWDYDSPDQALTGTKMRKGDAMVIISGVNTWYFHNRFEGHWEFGHGLETLIAIIESFEGNRP